MPVVDNELNRGGNQSGFDASVFLALAQNPTLFGEKLAELTQAKEDAEKARDEADARISLVAKADEIVALLEQTKVHKSLAEKALEEAQQKATEIVADANNKAAQLMSDADKHVVNVAQKITKAENALTAREGVLVSKEEALQAALVRAQEQEAIAKRLQEIAEKDSDEAKQLQKEAVERLNVIEQQFAAFIKAVQ